MGSVTTVVHTNGAPLNPGSIFNCQGEAGVVRESIVRFTAPYTGTFEIILSDAVSNENQIVMGSRQAVNPCNFNFGTVCAAIPGSNVYSIGILVQGSTYDFLLQPTVWGAGFGNTGISFNCPRPTNVTATPSAHGASVSYNCTCPASGAVVYRPMGSSGAFQTQTGALPIVLSNLLDNTQYEAYLKTTCGTSYSDSVPVFFRTLIDCSLAPAITCGTTFIYSHTNGDVSGNWTNYNCGPANNSPEKIIKFTPTQSGNYMLNCTQNIGWQVNSYAYIKPATGSCDATGWTCIGALSNIGSLSIGNLTANTAYLIVIDTYSQAGSFNRSFNIGCIGNCPLPATPGAVTGNAKVCPGSNGIVYTINPANNATIYNWTAPANATIASGQGTTSVTVNFNSAFVSGSISVTAGNGCGTSNVRNKSVSRNIPGTPAAITGQTFNLCNSATATYTIPATANATTYLWTAPAGGIVNSGQGTTSASITFPSGFVSGNVSVKAGTTCGYGGARNLAVKGSPAMPTVLNGPATACANQQGVNYSTTAIAGATGYNWGVPSGAAITSGQGTLGIVMRFGVNAGNVRVRSQNACGSSSYRNLAVAITCREGITVVDASEINIYPNPSRNYFTITVAESENFQLVVKDLLGREIKRWNVAGNTFDFGNDLTDGIYFAEVVYGDKRYTTKLIKKN